MENVCKKTTGAEIRPGEQQLYSDTGMNLSLSCRQMALEEDLVTKSGLLIGTVIIDWDSLSALIKGRFQGKHLAWGVN